MSANNVAKTLTKRGQRPMSLDTRPNPNPN